MIWKKMSKFRTKILTKNFDPNFLKTEYETFDQNFLEIKKIETNFLETAKKKLTKFFEN